MSNTRKIQSSNNIELARFKKKNKELYDKVQFNSLNLKTIDDKSLPKINKESAIKIITDTSLKNKTNIIKEDQTKENLIDTNDTNNNVNSKFKEFQNIDVNSKVKNGDDPEGLLDWCNSLDHNEIEKINEINDIF